MKLAVGKLLFINYFLYRQDRVRLRIKVSFRIGENSYQDQADVANFPADFFE